MFSWEIKLSLQSREHFVDPIFKKMARTPQCFTILCDQLLDDDVVAYEIESLQSRAHFVDLTLKKWSEAVSFFRC